MNSWQSRHITARLTSGHPIAQLLDATAAMVNHHDPDRWPDANTTAGVGSILDGILVLLNEDLGGMDGGSLWSEVSDLAEIVGWDLDASEIRWGVND